MTHRPDFLVSCAEFDLLLGDLGLDPAPFPLDVPSIGATVEQRAELTAAMRRDLAGRGLAVGDQVDAGLARLLRLLSQHDICVDTVGHLRRPMRALVAADRRAGVLGERVADQVRLTGIRPTEMAGAIVGLLPPADAGPVRTLSVPHELLARVVNAEDEPDPDPFGGELDDRTALTRAGMPARDAEALVELANNRLAGGQFGACRDARRSSTLVTWFDTHQGRYLMVSDDSWLSIAPADNKRIESRVSRLLSTMN